MDILVIGTGMYVTGRGTKTHGTILPAILEYQKKFKKINNIYFVGSNPKNVKESKKKVYELFRLTGISIPCKFFPSNNLNTNAYKDVLNKINKQTCAIISVPDKLHYKIASDCLQKNLHTLVVKPLTPTVAESKKLINLQHKKNLYGAVEFHKRWDKQNLILRDKFRSKIIGEPLYTWTEYSQRKTIPSKIFKSWVSKSNIIQYLGVHYIDIVRFITGASPIRTMALGQKQWLKKQNINVHDSVQCIIEWKLKNNQNFVQNLLLNWVDPETTTSMSDQKIFFVGTKGRIESNQKNRGLKIVSENSIEEPNPDFCHPYYNHQNLLEYKGYGIKSITTFLDDVVNINEKTKTLKALNKIRPTFKESLVSTAVVEAATKSLKNNGIWKKIKY